MQIREEQIGVFERQAAANFLDRLIGMVKQQKSGIPPWVDDTTLREMVACGVKKAQSHGLTWESSIGKFVGLMFAIAPNFDEHVPVRAVLSDARIPPDERVAELFKRLTPEQWAGAARRYDLAAWAAQPPSVE